MVGKLLSFTQIFGGEMGIRNQPCFAQFVVYLYVLQFTFEVLVVNPGIGRLFGVFATGLFLHHFIGFNPVIVAHLEPN